MTKKTAIAVYWDTKHKIHQLRHDLKVKTEEDVLKALIDFYESNGDPLIYEAMELIKKIRNGSV
jgi:hypothetical protein